MPKIDGVECPNAPYICRWSYGSPAQKYGLRGMHWIIEVNGLPTRDLDEFLTVSNRVSAILCLSLVSIAARGVVRYYTRLVPCDVCAGLLRLLLNSCPVCYCLTRGGVVRCCLMRHRGL